MKTKFLVSGIIYLLGQLCVPSFGYSQLTMHSKKENISYIINDVGSGWRISPDLNVDRLKVYCKDDSDMNIVKFISDVDSLSFQIQNHDTVRFSVILHEKDTAITEIIGVHDLPNQITNKDKLFFLSLFWSEAKYNFMNYDNLDFDWDSLYNSYIPLVLNSKTDYDYYQILKSFAAYLNDGHTAVYNNSQFSIYFDYVPVTLTHINGKVYILGYRESLKEKLEVGGEIIMIEDKPTDQYMRENVFPFISASTEQNKWSIATTNLSYGLKSKPLTFVYKSSNGKHKKVSLERNGESDRYDKNGNEKYNRIGNTIKRKRNLDLTYTSDSIAILNYSSFYPEKETIAKFEKLLPELLTAKGLVIDLRYNRGGVTDVAYSLIKRIIPTNYFLGLAAETRINDAVYKAMGFGYEIYEPYYKNTVYRQEIADTIRISENIDRIECPIVILIGENTFSAAEDFLLMIYEIEDRPKLIGSPTAGSTGAPLLIPDLPGGGYARICSRRCKYPISGKQFINSGIIPDITIYPTIEDMLSNKDVVLEKGIELVKEMEQKH